MKVMYVWVTLDMYNRLVAVYATVDAANAAVRQDRREILPVGLTVRKMRVEGV